MIMLLSIGCGGDFEQDFGGTILSPNYPNSYPTMVECIWRVKAPPNKFVSIRFNEFIGMNGTMQTCPLANVEIRDGDNKGSKLLGTVMTYLWPSAGNIESFSYEWETYGSVL